LVPTNKPSARVAVNISADDQLPRSVSLPVGIFPIHRFFWAIHDLSQYGSGWWQTIKYG